MIPILILSCLLVSATGITNTYGMEIKETEQPATTVEIGNLISEIADNATVTALTAVEAKEEADQKALKEEEERKQKEKERSERDEKDRVRSTQIVGSVVVLEKMLEAKEKPVDDSAILFRTRDMNGEEVLYIREDGEMKIWRHTSDPAIEANNTVTDEYSEEYTQTAEENYEEPYEEQPEEYTEGYSETYYEPEEVYYEEPTYEESTEEYVEEYVEESVSEESIAEETYEESYEEEYSESYTEESREESEYTEESSYTEEENSEESSYAEESSYVEESTAEEPVQEESSQQEEESVAEESSETTQEPVQEEPVYAPSGEYDYGSAYAIFEQTNALRASLGIEPLIWSDELASFASIRAQEISVSFSHYRLDGSYYWDWGPEHENLAWGYPSVSAVMDGWITSYDHYNNLISTYDYEGPTIRYVGVAVYVVDGVPYYVMSFDD